MTDSLMGEGQIQNILAKELGMGAEHSEPTSAEAALLAEAERDINDAAALSAGVQDAGIRLPAIASEEAEPPSQEDIRDQKNKMMARAAKQRKQGEIGLTRKEAGVAALIEDIEIKARPLSSVFVRWFSAIDMCAGNLQRYGEMVLGPRKAEQLHQQLKEMIDSVTEEAASELQRIQSLVETAEAAQKPGTFVRPSIITPALTKQGVTIGTRLGFKLYRAIKMLDEALDLMNPLVWNDVMSEEQQSEQELEYKRHFGKLYKFAAQVNINTHNLLKKGRGRSRRPDAGAPNGAEAPGAAVGSNVGEHHDHDAGVEQGADHAAHEAETA